MAIIFREKHDTYRSESIWIDGYIPRENTIKDDELITLENSLKPSYNSQGNTVHYEISHDLANELLENPNAELYQNYGNLKLTSFKGELLKHPKWRIEELPDNYKQESPLLRLYMDSIVQQYLGKAQKSKKTKNKRYKNDTIYLLYRKFTGDAMIVPKEFSSFYEDVFKENQDSYRQIILIGEKCNIHPIKECAENLIEKANLKVREKDTYKNYKNFSIGASAILESILVAFNYPEDELELALTSKIEEADLRLKLLGFNDPLVFSPSFGKFVLFPFRRLD